MRTGYCSNFFVILGFLSIIDIIFENYARKVNMNTQKKLLHANLNDYVKAFFTVGLFYKVLFIHFTKSNIHFTKPCFRILHRDSMMEP